MARSGGGCYRIGMLRAGSMGIAVLAMGAAMVMGLGTACGSKAGSTGAEVAGAERGAEAGSGRSGAGTGSAMRSGMGSGLASRSSSGSASASAPSASASAPSASASAASASAASASASATAAAPADAAPALPIVELPLAWSEERAALTLDYRQRHEAPEADSLDIEPRVIVLHYTGGGSAKNTKRYFDRLTMEASREQLASAGKVNVSSHYLIDRDGTIYRLQPETRFARHCIGLNHVAIGVENVGDEKKWKLTEAQVKANAALVRELARRFPITHLLGHYEVMQFRAHPYFVERDAGYRNRKPDPGARFMAAVRAELAAAPAERPLAGLTEPSAPSRE